ncbi:hypothetical protein [Nitratifractor salsuginis]|uniref:Excisionase n=1 Tax=Nitratifractor salsuginis (strain DSM 16511 / JCM 12458 / E9I37-1) TaxID=749222 RepID=E6WYE9_NITSE|nr:hypothetical protein [Nitratifractor salsuginis]ADV46461.1 hypothetical protein Nitsa_1208 [Nitratifractor salsuginis DSM 16511]
MNTKPKYLKTSQMAEFLGRSVRWIKKNKDVIFIKGKHYHQPPTEREPFWDVAAMEAWVRSEERDERTEDILKKVS